MADCVTAPYDLETLQSPPFLQVWMIVAIGRLFVGEFGENEDVPGQNLFDFIMKSFPTLGALYSLGTLGIELAALVAVYLQNSNCKEEAYIYVRQPPHPSPLPDWIANVGIDGTLDQHSTETGSITRASSSSSYYGASAIRKGAP